MIDIEKFLVSLRSNKDLDGKLKPIYLADTVQEEIKIIQTAVENSCREWVGLTDEERHDIREWQEIQKELGPVWAPMMLYLYVAIEAKLKEKNNG